MKHTSRRRTHAQIQDRLAYLREEIEAERISYEEIAELTSLKRYIDRDDVQLAQWAGKRERSCPR